MGQHRLIVVAIGGNSLIEDAKNISIESQFAAASKTARHIASLAQSGYRIVIVHGNGPQVGFALQRSEALQAELFPQPLDVCVAETQGSIGYQLQMALHNELQRLAISRQVCTVLTQVIVDPTDRAFEQPTKPIGSFMSEAEALHRVRTEQWSVVSDAGRGFRRVVPSPQPQAIVELETIATLVAQQTIVIAAGGGGIPVTLNSDGTLVGCEAVIDKDLAAALLARQLGADLLLISTAVQQVYLNYGSDRQKPLSKVSVAECKEYIAQGHFAAGSMLPKIEAQMSFISASGKEGIITSPEYIVAALRGEKGTRIYP